MVWELAAWEGPAEPAAAEEGQPQVVLVAVEGSVPVVLAGAEPGEEPAGGEPVVPEVLSPAAGCPVAEVVGVGRRSPIQVPYRKTDLGSPSTHRAWPAHRELSARPS